MPQDDGQRSGGGDSRLGADWASLVEHGRRLSEAIAERLQSEDTFMVPDPGVIAGAFFQVIAHVLSQPDSWLRAQASLLEKQARLWQVMLAAGAGEVPAPVIEPKPGDQRFKDDEWSTNPFFATIKQHYLLTSEWLMDLVASADGIDPQTKRKALFYARQLVSALAPTNFPATNPVVIRETVASGGENLRRGYLHLLQDLERSRGQLQVSMTDERAFRLGENIATTPGKVIYQNELMQLIQYAPATKTVNRRPLLIVPPWINKFYVLDLQPRKSFLKWAVEQGHTVFVISWVNPDERLADKRFDDYMLQGPIAALDVVRELTGEPDVNAIGYCIGGTLLACTLAYLAAKGERPVVSATFLTTLLDFSDPGELAVFIDEEQISLLEKHMDKNGYLEGAQMKQVFSMLRENDLIWPYYVRNYLLGKEPPAFDILYWNADSTRMPRMMHSFYLRELYLGNRLVQPGAVVIADTPIDLGRIDVPAYFVATHRDHIAPWKTSFIGSRALGGPVTFVLAGSGHIAGIINPPTSHKYGYWTNRSKKIGDPDAWLRTAKQHEGSWWPHWNAWVRRFASGKVAARPVGSDRFPPLEDAPGSYVKVRSEW